MDVLKALYDLKLLQRISDMVTQGFGTEDVPPHRLPSSSNLMFDGNSKIFVIDHDAFIEMEPETIQDIFRHRNILVTGVKDGKRVEFNARGLSLLAPLDQPIQIQCEIFTTLW